MRDYGTATWQGGDAGCDHSPARKNGKASSTLTGGQSGNSHEQEPYIGQCGKCGAVRIDAQIGLEATPEEYVAHIVAVMREVWRVLRDDGVLFLNLGDSYMSSGARSTGRNDTNRETPGGRGGSFRGGERHVISYGTSGKAPVSYSTRDCLCGSLCGACRKAYRIGKSHSGSLPVPMLTASPSATNHAHTESVPDHLPTSGSSHRASRNVVATPDSEPTATRVDAQPLDAQASTMTESSLLPSALNSEASIPVALCQLCGCSLPDSTQASADKSLCPCEQYSISSSMQGLEANRRDKVLTVGASDYHIEDKVSDLPYPYYTTTSIKPKDLVGIPWMVAFALRADGWYLRSDIIWSKSNPMPESVTDRPTKAHEYVFLLSKSARYYYDAEAIKEPAQPFRTGGRNNALDNPHTPRPGKKQDELGKPTYTGFNERWQSNPVENRNKRTVWTIPTNPYSGAHFATFPPALVTPMVLAGTSAKGVCAECGAPWERVTETTHVDGGAKWKPNAGNRAALGDVSESSVFRTGMRPQVNTTGWRPTCTHDAPIVPAIVLDPFAGSGTLGEVCRSTGRRFVGLDLNMTYLRELALPRAEGKQHAEANQSLPMFAGMSL